MNHSAKKSDRSTALGRAPGVLWITLEAPEVIELKRIAIDCDGPGAVAFFREVLVPRVCSAAQRRGVALELLGEVENDGCLPG